MSWFFEHSSALAGLGGMATIVAAIVAVFTLMRAGLDSASRTRPYVVVEFDVPEYRYKRIDLVVRNTGPTAARDLGVTFDPPFEESEDLSRLGSFVAQRYRDRLPVLGPGQVLRSILIVDTDDDSKSDVPSVLTARVSYGSPWWRRRYCDTFVLNRIVYTSQVFSESSDSEKNSLKKIASATEKLPNAHRDLVRQLRYFQESVVAALGNSGPGLATVAWRIRERDESVVLVENTGSSTAFRVTLEGSPDIRHLSVLGDEAPDIRPGEFLKVHVLGHGHTPELTVAWTDEPGGEIQEHSWTGKVPS